MTIEDLFNATVKLEEKEKVYSNAEGEVIKYLEHKTFSIASLLFCPPAHAATLIILNRWEKCI